MIESCAMDYCQDGLQVYFATETQQYTYAPIYGHYELQPNDVNNRPYFKMNIYGFWYTNGIWWIGLDSNNGQSAGYAYYFKDIFCPHEFSELHWWLWDGHNREYNSAGNNLVITCKCSNDKTFSWCHISK